MAGANDVRGQGGAASVQRPWGSCCLEDMSELGVEGFKTAFESNGFTMMWGSQEAQVGGKER